MPDDNLNDLMDDVSQEQQEKFGLNREEELKRVEQMRQQNKVIKTIDIDDNKRVKLLGNGIVLERHRGDEWNSERIYSGKFCQRKK